MKHMPTRGLNILQKITICLSLTVCIGGLVSIAASAADKAKDIKADVVYRNGFVYTVDSVLSHAEAFAVKEGKFIAVGSNDDMKAFIGKDTKTVDLKGKMVMPGLVDAHIHALRGALTSLGRLLSHRLRRSTRSRPRSRSTSPTRNSKRASGSKAPSGPSTTKNLMPKMLDEVSPDNPVFLHDWTNHLGWVNTAALKAAKITKDTPDPE